MESTGPSPGAMSAMSSWGLDDAITPGTEAMHHIRDQVVLCMVRICETHGGPQQYLLNTFDTRAKREAFGKWLYTEFPPDPTFEYQTHSSWEAVSKSEISTTAAKALHISCLVLTRRRL